MESAFVKECPQCLEKFVARNSRHRFCSRECRQKYYEEGVFNVFERDEFRCVYCGASSIEDGVKLHVEHVVPKSAGGQDVAGNLVTSCRACNSEKGTRELSREVVERLKELAHARNLRAGIEDEKAVWMRVPLFAQAPTAE